MNHEQVRDLAIKAGASEEIADYLVETGRQVLAKKAAAAAEGVDR